MREGTRLETHPRAAGTRRSARATTRASAGSATGLVESAYAEDGSLEAIEDPSKQFALGVLWHPEMEEDDKRLFEALVVEARRTVTASRGSLARRAKPRVARDWYPQVELEVRRHSPGEVSANPSIGGLPSRRRGIRFGQSLAGACGTPARPNILGLGGWRTDTKRGPGGPL